MVAWTAVHALMLEMIWFLPCDWSVPVLFSKSIHRRGGFFRVLTFSEDDDGRRLAAERHSGEEFLGCWGTGEKTGSLLRVVELWTCGQTDGAVLGIIVWLQESAAGTQKR